MGRRHIGGFRMPRPHKPAIGPWMLAVALTLAFGSAVARADDYPVRPVHIIIGYGPGSAADVSARVIGQQMGKILGQQFIVESRPGNGSNIAAEVVARAPKDGYTLVMGNVANAVTA